MFEKAGRNIDNFLVDVMCINRKFFWYKIYTYYFIKRNLSLNLIETAYKCKLIYKWQYNRLIKTIDKNIKV